MQVFQTKSPLDSLVSLYFAPANSFDWVSLPSSLVIEFFDI